MSYLLNRSGEAGVCADGFAVRTHPAPQLLRRYLISVLGGSVAVAIAPLIGQATERLASGQQAGHSRFELAGARLLQGSHGPGAVGMEGNRLL